VLGIKPFQGRALEAYSSPLARINIYDGAVRSSKTITSIMRWARWVREEAPPGMLMMVGKTERTVKQNVVDPLIEVFGERHAKYSAGNHELVLFGRRHTIIGAADERAEGKIRGITLAGCYGDEVTLWPESFFSMLLSRMSVENASFLGTTNPDSPSHWLNRDYLRRAGELGLNRFIFKLRDNPHLPSEFVRQLELEYVGLWRRRFLEGEWVIAEGAIFDMLDPARHHWKGDVPRGDTVIWRVGAADYGTSNPTVFLAMTFTEDHIIVHDEWRHDSRAQGRQMTMDEYSKAYQEWRDKVTGPLDRFYVDPSANSFILQVWRDGEKHVKPADNDVVNGVMETASLLQAGIMKFHEPTTQRAWDEMTSYVWDPMATLRGEDKPLKQDDHAPDALRYGVRGSRLRWKRMLADLASAA
jgi:PBSX family phage terminase large subunit